MAPRAMSTPSLRRHGPRSERGLPGSRQKLALLSRLSVYWHAAPRTPTEVAMTELMRFHTSTGSVVVEVDDVQGGYGQVDRGSGIIADARTKIDAALAEVRDTAENALRTFRDASL